MRNRNRVIKNFVCIIFGLIFVPGTFNLLYSAQRRIKSPNYIFYKANSLYENAHYDEAITEYNQLLKDGYESGNLYYNLGNCYFKKGELGKAILNYERARRLIPRDKDLESNYEYAKSLIKNNTKEHPGIWIVRLKRKFSSQFSIDEMTFLLSIIYIILVVILITNIFVKGFKKYAVIGISILFLLLGLSISSFIDKRAHLGKDAIVIVAKADAKFEPFDKSTTYFILYEGMKVSVIDEKENWRKVERDDGKVGWVRKSALGMI